MTIYVAGEKEEGGIDWVFFHGGAVAARGVDDAVFEFGFVVVAVIIYRSTVIAPRHWIAYN